VIAPATEILVRKCSGYDEYEACVRMQTETWGYDASDTIPLREFIVIERIGGQVLGAFDLARSTQPNGDASTMIGFAMSMPAILHRQIYLHSHMLAVLPSYRNAGIGRKLKLMQRDDALARGIPRMEWTFDPLEIKNAYLNIVRLGAVVHSYTPNFYGVFSSRLQAGLPTDRLHAEWLMDSPRVEAALSGNPISLPPIKQTITVPGAIQEWKLRPETFTQAQDVQTKIRAQFLDAFNRGLSVVGFINAPPQPDAHQVTHDGVYQLAEWHEP
jgi:predicted GNAT superfamily acetyltransferase